MRPGHCMTEVGGGSSRKRTNHELLEQRLNLPKVRKYKSIMTKIA